MSLIIWIMYYEKHKSDLQLTTLIWTSFCTLLQKTDGRSIYQVNADLFVVVDMGEVIGENFRIY